MAMSFSRRRSGRNRRRVSRPEPELTPMQWQALLEEWYGCAYCLETSVELARDRVESVARGGGHTLGNVVPACATCMRSKGDGDTVGWLRNAGFDEMSFLMRQREIANRIALRSGDVDKTA
jgi:hypothetical protein